MTAVEKSLLKYALKAVFDGELEISDQEWINGKYQKKKSSNISYRYEYKPKKMPSFNFPDEFGKMNVMSFYVSMQGGSISFGGACYEGPAFDYDLYRMKLKAYN